MRLGIRMPVTSLMHPRPRNPQGRGVRLQLEEEAAAEGGTTPGLPKGAKGRPAPKVHVRL